MIHALCKVLRPVCVISTVVMMGLLIAYFWEALDLTAGSIWRLVISYGVLIAGSFIIFLVDDPTPLRRGRDH